jgi:hypothetical protein
MNVCNRVAFVLGEPFRPSIILFAGDVKGLSYRGTSFGVFTWVGSGLTCKHSTGLERLARDNH